MTDEELDEELHRQGVEKIQGNREFRAQQLLEILVKNEEDVRVQYLFRL